MSNDEELVVVEEYDQLFKYYNDLQKPDFFENNDFLENMSETQKKKIAKREQYRKEGTFVEEPYSTDEEGEEDPELEEASRMTLHENRPIDVINYKLSKLDSIFANLSGIENDRSLLYTEPNFKKREEIQARKDHETKQLNLFAGMYSVKSVFYKDKSKIPPPISLKLELSESSNTPKLAETYQFSGYLAEASKITPLPNDVDIKDVQYKVFNSIQILKRQPHYRKFLKLIYYNKLFQLIITDTFWWCFLEKYQKIAVIQKELFRRISESYVALTYLEMDKRYKETFFKKIADYLAMSVYTIFCTCFPDSYLTQFNIEFKEFICEICYLWITGCRPIPKSFSNWNFNELDPASAVRAKEILNTSRSINDDSISNRATSQSNRTGTQSVTTVKSFSKTKSSLKSRSLSSGISKQSLKTSNESNTNRSVKSSVLPSESHPLCASHDIKNTLFNINGHSPLIDCYLFNHKSRKINKADTLIQHATVIDLPPLNAPTYNDVIRNSLRAIHKIEKDLKQTTNRQEEELVKMKNNRIKYMRNFKKKQEKLLANPNQCTILGELLIMSQKKDPYTSNFGLDIALNKAFQNSCIEAKKTAQKETK